MNHQTRSTLRLLACVWIVASTTSCTCYRSFVEADFHQHAADSRKHQDFTAHWNDGDGFHSSINPLLMVDTRSASGDLQIISHQPARVHSHLVFEQITMTNRFGRQVAGDLPPMPWRIRFQETKSSRYVAKDQWIDGRKNVAKAKFRPVVAISKSPYTIHIRGYCLQHNGSRDPFDTTIRMDLSRDRSLEPIADCWP